MAQDSGAGLLQLVTFSVGDEEYSLDILKVHEINRMLPITAVPNAPAGVEGVVNLRGRVIPVVNLRKRFGLPEREADSRSRIVVVDAGTGAGLMVDSVSEVLRMPADVVEPPPAMTVGAASDYVRGIGKVGERLLILLDAEKLVGNGNGTGMGCNGPPGDGAIDGSGTGRGRTSP